VSTASAISRSARLLVAAATTCLVAAAASAVPDAQAKHCRVCRVGGSLTLQVQPKPQDPEYPLLVYVVASGSVSSKQKLCRKAGTTEIWRRLSNGSPDRDIGAPQHSAPSSFLAEASFNIDDGNDRGNALTRYPPGSTVEFWAVRPKFKTSSGIIGSPVYKCKRLESPHVFVPVPSPPPSAES
jgi:hypothetical protein